MFHFGCNIVKCNKRTTSFSVVTNTVWSDLVWVYKTADANRSKPNNSNTWVMARCMHIVIYIIMHVQLCMYFAYVQVKCVIHSSLFRVHVSISTELLQSKVVSWPIDMFLSFDIESDQLPTNYPFTSVYDILTNIIHSIGHTNGKSGNTNI